jgi:hypothetical protein
VWAGYNPQKHLDLFVAAADGFVYSTYFDNGHWEPRWVRPVQ